MAHGCDCKDCGHQETPHFKTLSKREFSGRLSPDQYSTWLANNEIDADLLVEGRQITLRQCGYFEYQEEDLDYVQEQEEPGGGAHEGQH